MKRRKPLKTKTPIKRTGGPKRRTRVKPRNDARAGEAKARDFGEEAKLIRLTMTPGQCVTRRGSTPQGRCSGRIQPSHDPSRGSGGGRFDMTRKCKHHHDEFHSIGRLSFQRKHGVDLRAEADRLAIEWPRPLGIKGVADRWVGWTLYDEALAEWRDGDRAERPDDPPFGPRLDAYETRAIRGWLAREMAMEVERRSGEMIVCDGLGLTDSTLAALSNLARSAYATAGLGDGLPPNDRKALAHHIAHLLGGPFLDDPHGEHGLAWSLCEWAGWP